MRAFTRPGGRYPVVTHSTAGLLDWRRLVAQQAQAHGGGPAEGAVAVELHFRLTAPLRSKRKLPTTRPDLDKLVRAVLDALTGVVWRDDSQVVEILAHKSYALPGTSPGVDVVVTATEGKPS